MAEVVLSRRAAADVDAVAEFTIERFGVLQARHYRDELKRCFEELAQNPMMGRPATHLAPGLRRHEHGSHIVFYKITDRGVLIVRLLHYRMNSARQF